MGSVFLGMLPSLIGTLIRSATIAGGTAAVATAEVSAPSTGVLTGDDIQAAIGAIGIAVAAVWGVIEKLKRGQHG